MPPKGSLSQDVKDILDIIHSAVLPALGKLQSDFKTMQSDFKTMQSDFKDMTVRQDRFEKKLDKVAEIVTISQKQNDDRFRTIEHKLGIYHD